MIWGHDFFNQMRMKSSKVNFYLNFAKFYHFENCNQLSSFSPKCHPKLEVIYFPLHYKCTYWNILMVIKFYLKLKSGSKMMKIISWWLQEHPQQKCITLSPVTPVPGAKLDSRGPIDFRRAGAPPNTHELVGPPIHPQNIWEYQNNVNAILITLRKNVWICMYTKS